jgi:uncharacterized protein (TIGR02466 family)
MAQQQQQGGNPRAEVRWYFPTPVAVLQVPTADRINPVLRETILQRERARPSLQHSNQGGWQSSWDFPEWCGAAGQAVLDAGRDLATKLTADRQGRGVQVTWRMNAWANVNRSGHGNEFHTHPGSYWSATYYVDDGGVADDPSLGGEFEIQDPRGVGPAMYAPNLAFNFPAGRSVGASELIRPQAGLLVLFPAWLSHQVRPYYGERTRISVAFNLGV